MNGLCGRKELGILQVLHPLKKVEQPLMKPQEIVRLTVAEAEEREKDAKEKYLKAWDAMVDCIKKHRT